MMSEGGRGGGGWVVFDTIILLKCTFLVFHGVNGQNEYVLIIYTFINIVLNVACIDL